MELRQRTELKRLLVPQLAQSLNILALSSMEMKDLIEQELENNPLLEELPPPPEKPLKTDASSLPRISLSSEELDYQKELITKKPTLQDILTRQLGMFTDTDEDFRIGQEIIGNIDENGYLKATLDEIASSLKVTVQEVERTLKLIQDFEPAGVGARSTSECLLIQLKVSGETDPLLIKIIDSHLEDVAKKNYTLIAKSLKEPLEKIEPLIKKIAKLDPKPGRNYSTEETQRIIPDVTIDENDAGLTISINNEDTSLLGINRTYKEMLENNKLDPQTKEFLSQKMRAALELLRAVSKRHNTLRRVMEVIVDTQAEALKNDLSFLKPMTFQEVAQKLQFHESTVCRAVMNKYVKTPYCGVVALKDFFPSQIQSQDDGAVSSSHVKRLIKELIDWEDKKHPLSDQQLCEILVKGKNNIRVSRRTIAKYREELKILSTTFRREK